MDMSIKETGSNQLTVSINYFCVFSDTMGSIADECDSAAGNCDICVIDNLVCANIYQTSVFDYGFSGGSAHSDIR